VEQEINGRKSRSGMHLLWHSLTIRNPWWSYDLENILNVFFYTKISKWTTTQEFYVPENLTLLLREC